MNEMVEGQREPNINVRLFLFVANSVNLLILYVSPILLLHNRPLNITDFHVA